MVRLNSQLVAVLLCVLCGFALFVWAGLQHEPGDSSTAISMADLEPLQEPSPVEDQVVSLPKAEDLGRQAGAGAEAEVLLTANDFLASYARADYVREELARKGRNPDELPAIPQLDDCWEGISEQLIYSELIRESMLDDLTGWREDWSMEQVAAKIGVDLKGKTIPRDEIEPLLREESDRIRQAVNQRFSAFENAYVEALARRDFIASPYVADKDEMASMAAYKKDQGLKVFHSKTVGSQGWTISFMLDAETYPDLFQKCELVFAARAAQSAKLQELIDAWP